MHGAVLTEQYTMPDVTLTATDGQPYSLTEDTTKPVTLVFFGYTHCDICQIVMADITSALTRLDERDRADVGCCSHQRPARDDPETLRAYLDRFDPGFEGVTGDLETIVDVGHSSASPSRRAPGCLGRLRGRARHADRGGRRPRPRAGGVDRGHTRRRPRRDLTRLLDGAWTPRSHRQELLVILASIPSPDQESGTSGRSRCGPTRCASSPASWSRCGWGAAVGGPGGRRPGRRHRDLGGPFGLVGGRLYHVATDYQLYFGEAAAGHRALYVWQGGLGIWG